MIENEYLIYAIGFGAQLLFSARMVIQLFLSEKAGESLSPTIYWQLSLLASLLMLAYGIFRLDFAIVFGQFLLFYIYIRNLQLKNNWSQFPRLSRFIIPLLPIAGLGFMVVSGNFAIDSLFKNKDVSQALLVWGVVAQLVFIFRFIFQWFESENRKESILSTKFWLISLCGSLMILSYAILRKDPVLFIGQLVGACVYSRNIYLGLRKK